MSVLNDVRRIITEAGIDELDNFYVARVVELYKEFGVNSQMLNYEHDEGVIRKKVVDIWKEIKSVTDDKKRLVLDIGYSILGFVRSEMLEGSDRIEEMDSNYFTGSVDFYILAEDGLSFQQFAKKSENHLNRAREIWKCIKGEHGYMMYRVSRAGDVHRLLFLISEYYNKPNEEFLKNAWDLANKAYYNLQNVPVRDRVQIEKVYDNVIKARSRWAGKKNTKKSK